MFLAYIVLFHAQRDLAVVSEKNISQGLKLLKTKKQIIRVHIKLLNLTEYLIGKASCNSNLFTCIVLNT